MECCGLILLSPATRMNSSFCRLVYDSIQSNPSNAPLFLKDLQKICHSMSILHPSERNLRFIEQQCDVQCDCVHLIEQLHLISNIPCLGIMSYNDEITDPVLCETILESFHQPHRIMLPNVDYWWFLQNSNAWIEPMQQFMKDHQPIKSNL
jgi:hypothetical protein